MKKQTYRYSGFTLVELVMGFLVAGVSVLCIGFFMADNQRCYSEIYQQALSDDSQDERVVKAVFNKTIRQASFAGTASVDTNGQWLEVQYYSSSAVASPDRYALFYVSNGTLSLEKGVLETHQQLSTQSVCDNVNAVQFDLAGTSVQMFLDIDDGTKIRRVNISAVMRSP